MEAVPARGSAHGQARAPQCGGRLRLQANPLDGLHRDGVRARAGLDKYLKEHEGEQLSLEWIAALLDQLCAVLQEAHGHLDEKSGKPKPIIHRDLKPSSLMLMDRKPPGQNLKVLDFGIAKMIEEDRGPEVTLRLPGISLGRPPS